MKVIKVVMGLIAFTSLNINVLPIYIPLLGTGLVE